MFAKSRLLKETGSGSVVVLLVTALILSVGFTTIWVSRNIFGQLSLQTQTESAALAAQLTLQGALAGFPCENAKQVFTLNMVFLDKCLIVGDEVVVQTRWQPFGIALRAIATAVPRLAK